MSAIHKLTELFKKFPGIGPRQAERFVYFLLFQNENYRRNLADQIIKIKDEIFTCQECFKFFQKTNGEKICGICSSSNTDNTILMIVAKDVDLENINDSDAYSGRYFVLGGLIPILEKTPEDKVRLNQLTELVKKLASKELKEVIIALSANPEGDYTANYLKNLLQPITEPTNLKISLLGRGLSTGTELEYSDSDTIKNALKHRG